MKDCTDINRATSIKRPDTRGTAHSGLSGCFHYSGRLRELREIKGFVLNAKMADREVKGVAFTRVASAQSFEHFHPSRGIGRVAYLGIRLALIVPRQRQMNLAVGGFRPRSHAGGYDSRRVSGALLIQPPLTRLASSRRGPWAEAAHG